MTLSSELLLNAYRRGIFPMGDERFPRQIYWMAPDPRAILPLDAFHVPRSVARLVRKGVFEVARDRQVEAVIRACAAPAPGRERTWITPVLIQAYTELARQGYVHSVECYLGGELVGGLYGVVIGGAFFGESMFHRVSDASKVALVHLVEHLRKRGFSLLDVQYANPHLEQFGVIEIPRHRYERLLAHAIHQPVTWED